jgi:hypothetical protein
MRPRIHILALAAGALTVLSISVSPAIAAKGGSGFKTGTFNGKTGQTDVDSDFRNISLKVKKGRVTLVTEPVIRREFCTSAPVFTLEGATPSKPLSRRGTFSFTSTFLGTQIDKISGHYVTPSKIEGTIVYHFAASDLCSPGAAKTTFAANQGKKKKKKK